MELVPKPVLFIIRLLIFPYVTPDIPHPAADRFNLNRLLEHFEACSLETARQPYLLGGKGGKGGTGGTGSITDSLRIYYGSITDPLRIHYGFITDSLIYDVI